MPRISNRTARLEARVSPEGLAIVKSAADLQGRSVSDFVVTAAQDMAQRTIEEANLLRPMKINAASSSFCSTHQNPRRPCDVQPGPRRSHRPGVTVRYRIEPLAAEHDRRGFASGSEPLDRYFQVQVGQDVRRRVAACYVAIDLECDTISGYYTLSGWRCAPGRSSCGAGQAVATGRCRWHSLAAWRYSGIGKGRNLARPCCGTPSCARHVPKSPCSRWWWMPRMTGRQPFIATRVSSLLTACPSG